MLWSVFSVTGKQLLLIQKKKNNQKKLVKTNKKNCARNKSSQLEHVGGSQSAARSFSVAYLARGVTLRRESQECY